MSKSRLSFIEAIDRAKEQISRIPELNWQRSGNVRVPNSNRMNEGQRIVRVERSTNVTWYRNLIGCEFSVLMFSIPANEYTVYHDGEYRILRADDVEIVRG